MKISAIDLFCGAGGMTNGLIQSGIDVKLGIDNDPNCKYPYTHNNNTEFLLESVANLQIADLIDIYDSTDIKILAGCAPCQSFSTLNLHKKKR